MKYVLLLTLFLTGCATTSNEQLYYDASKAISKDQTVTSAACYAAVGEIAKGGDNSAKVAAISLSEKCKSAPIKIEAPKKNWLGF